MIENYVGLIGGGKTYNAILRMLQHISRGGCVVTNINLMLHPWKNNFKLYHSSWSDDAGNNAKGVIHVLAEYYHWKFHPGQFIYIDNSVLTIQGVVSRIPAGAGNIPVLVVLDEAGDFWDVDDRSKADKEFMSFLKHSRKLNIDFIFIIQELSELNKRIVNQSAYVWKFTDMATFKFPGLGLSARVIPGLHNQIRVLQFLRSQFGRSSSEPCYAGWQRKEQDIFSCYQTEALHTICNVQLGVQTEFSGGEIVPDYDKFSWLYLSCGCLAGALAGGLFF